jgi:hypothetical protein
MGYNTRNYWVLGLCPSFDILKTGKLNVLEIGFLSGLNERRETPAM